MNILRYIFVYLFYVFILQLQVATSTFNYLAWDKTRREVTSPLLSLDVRTEDGEEYEAELLKTPLVITLKNDVNNGTLEAIQNTTVDEDTDMVYITVLIDSAGSAYQAEIRPGVDSPPGTTIKVYYSIECSNVT